ncbi:hypothetical protein JXQ70_06655 [bacterium]|nr:hypothetical protein [bacterium]
MSQKQPHVFEVTVELTISFEVMAFNQQQVEEQVQRLLTCGFTGTNNNLLDVPGRTITSVGIREVPDEQQPSFQKETHHVEHV